MENILNILKLDSKSLIKRKQDWIEKKKLLGLDDPEKMEQYEVERHRKGSKIFYEKHKEEILIKRKQNKVYCECCQIEIRKDYYSQHLKSKKHEFNQPTI